MKLRMRVIAGGRSWIIVGMFISPEGTILVLRRRKKNKGDKLFRPYKQHFPLKEVKRG